MSRYRLTRAEYLAHPARFALRGEAVHGAKLNANAVRRIRASDEPTHVLAERFGVSRRCIREVRSFDTWVHVREK